jgi:hypothetical protein
MQIDLQPLAEATLARKLGIAPRLSMLHKKAGNIGIPQPEYWIALALQRGCYHYRNDQTVSAISIALLSNEELSALLLSGANPYRPLLIRVAAQLLSNPAIDTTKLRTFFSERATEFSSGFQPRLSIDQSPLPP